VTSPSVVLVQSESDLLTLVRALEPHAVLALDTESDGFFRYRARLCLLQLAAPGVCALVDPLAHMDLAPLWKLLGDAGREVILHDAEQDVALIRRQHGATLGRIFDTQYASRLLGIAQVGLANVLNAFFGLTLDKGEQRSDWSRRPLSPRQTEYAAADVLHLVALRDRLHAQLMEKDRLSMAQQSFERIRTRTIDEKPVDLEAWRTLKDARVLDAAARGALGALYVWREKLATDRDVAPFRVMGNETLVELSKRRPADVPSLLKVRGVSPVLAQGPEGQALLSALAMAQPLDGPLLPPRPKETDEDRRIEERFEALRAWRVKAATAMGVEVGIIVSNAVLKQLSKAPPSSVQELSSVAELLPWQAERFAAGMMEVLVRKG
jgi:ribonuclease D